MDKKLRVPALPKHEDGKRASEAKSTAETVDTFLEELNKLLDTEVPS